ncbi:GNAT family N-acetyltransferase [Chitinimonas sp. BJYL2]|uniref:GNAT family N-acetyltransferase n=1 Tax=Chitinimonas sp. BJYL2 TaxID=2976696 RepID=UPI0022B2CBC3|nr:GNAT family N-acetyltransferase [Chitinimonas sp. BJYL2]
MVDTTLHSRRATLADVPLLAELNQQFNHDEGHGTIASLKQLQARLHDWLASGEYAAVLFDHQGQTVAYALYREQAASINLRQFFVAGDRRRHGLGRRALALLFSDYWPADKRLSVDVPTRNERALAFWRSVGFLDYCTTLIMAPKQRPNPEQRTSP